MAAISSIYSNNIKKNHELIYNREEYAKHYKETKERVERDGDRILLAFAITKNRDGSLGYVTMSRPSKSYYQKKKLEHEKRRKEKEEMRLRLQRKRLERIRKEKEIQEVREKRRAKMEDLVKGKSIDIKI